MTNQDADPTRPDYRTRSRSSIFFGWFSCLPWLLLSPTPAHALQPLSTFLRGAEANPEHAEAVAEARKHALEEKAASYRLLPSLSVEGSYTRNQYERDFVVPGSNDPQPFMPLNQLDAAITLTVPLINVELWETRASTGAASQLARANEAAVRQDLERRIVQAYYQLLGSAAVHEAARQNLEIAQDNRDLVQDGKRAGTATELDLQRARADVARAEQDVTSARVARDVAANALATVSQVTPEPVRSFPKDDLNPVAPLAQFTQTVDSTPLVAAAKARAELAERQAKASQAVWYPTVTGMAQQRFTNATALVGHEAYYLFQVKAAWRFEFQSLHTTDAQRQGAQAAQAHEERRRQELLDAVFSAWSHVHAGIEKAKSARERAHSADVALDLARQQYRAGVVTQLEVLSAQRTAFSAEVGRIQADADLAYARATLRVLSGRALSDD